MQEIFFRVTVFWVESKTHTLTSQGCPTAHKHGSISLVGFNSIKWSSNLSFFFENLGKQNKFRSESKHGNILQRGFDSYLGADFVDFEPLNPRIISSFPFPVSGWPIWPCPYEAKDVALASEIEYTKNDATASQGRTPNLFACFGLSDVNGEMLGLRYFGCGAMLL